MFLQMTWSQMLKDCSNNKYVHPFYRVLFNNMAMNMLPSGISIGKDGKIQFRLCAVHGKTEEFPDNLLPYLQSYNDSVTVGQIKLCRSLLPELETSEMASQRPRKGRRPTADFNFFLWHLHEYTRAQNEFAIPVLFEWFCGYQRHQRALYEFLTKQQTKIEVRIGRNIRLMVLLDLVYANAIQQYDKSTSEKMCRKVQSMFSLGEIIVNEQADHRISGWFFIHDTKKQTMHILPPEEIMI